MLIENADVRDVKYDLVIVGSGFGAQFFALSFSRNNPHKKILMIEKGPLIPYEKQLSLGVNSSIDNRSTFDNATPNKEWLFTVGYGGGLNCWAGISPRILPSSFNLKETVGVASDWPIGYGELAPFYTAAEKILGISGPDDLGLVYGDQFNYPLPPHHLSSVDEMMKAAQPEQHFSVPQARASIPTADRSRCCSTNRCSLCPLGAKSSWFNRLQFLLESEQIDVLQNANVIKFGIYNHKISNVTYQFEGDNYLVEANHFLLAANAIESPAILKRSGYTHRCLGHYLHEKYPVIYEVKLSGVDNFDGSSPIVGMNLSLSEGEFQTSAGASVLMFCNHWEHFGLRKEFGRWRQTLAIEAYIETEPLFDNRVDLTSNGIASVRHETVGQYALNGEQWVASRLGEVLAPLPVETISAGRPLGTLGHVQGTLRMGTDPASSVTDENGKVHDLENLYVAGSSLWPSCTTVNPSLTVAALALRSGERII